MPERPQQANRSLVVRDIGRMAYDDALALQESMAEERIEGRIPDTLILVEHDPVYTLGRNATRENIIASGEELADRGIDVKATTRGGEVTYHGPGQVVGYPILHLGELRGKVLWYVEQLEQVLIDTLGSFGVTGRRDSINRGVWIGDEKIAALGVRVSRKVTMHGFALNVRVALSDYGGIIPCGIAERGVTSMHRLIPDIDVAQVKPVLIEKFRNVFAYLPAAVE